VTANFLESIIQEGPNSGKTVGECIVSNMVIGETFIITRFSEGEIVNEHVPYENVKEERGRK
jgi:aminoglycoside phosphotransferase (APT) family kinase protein